MNYCSTNNRGYGYSAYAVDPFAQLERSIAEAFGNWPTAFTQDASGSDSTRRPRSSWYSNNEGYLLAVELPGVAVKDVSIEVEDGSVALSAQRTFAAANEKSEPRTVSYKLNVAVPDGVDAGGIRASQEDGIVSINFPKAEKAKPRVIEVQSGVQS